MTDPLSISVPLQGLETGLPLLPEADYEVQCTESKVEPNNRQDGFNWNLQLNTTQPTKANDGRDVQPNFPLFVTMALQPAPESKDPDAFRRNLGSTVDALFGTSKDNRPDFSAEVVNGAVGRKCIAHVYNEEYPKGSGQLFNRVRRLKASV